MFCGGEAPSEDSFFRAQDSNGAIGCLLDIGVWRWKPTILVLYCLYMPAPIGGLNCHKWQYFPFERKRSISALFAQNLQIMPRQRQSGSAGGPSRAQAPTY